MMDSILDRLADAAVWCGWAIERLGFWLFWLGWLAGLALLASSCTGGRP